MNNFISLNKHKSVLAIGLENFRTLCSIGICDHELNAPQEIFLELKIFLGAELAQIQDIKNTLNYSAVADDIREICQSRHFFLVENLIHTLTGHIFAKYSIVAKIFIKIKKPRAVAFAEVSIQAELTRN